MVGIKGVVSTVSIAAGARSSRAAPRARTILAPSASRPDSSSGRPGGSHFGSREHPGCPLPLRLHGRLTLTGRLRGASRRRCRVPGRPLNGRGTARPGVSKPDHESATHKQDRGSGQPQTETGAYPWPLAHCPGDQTAVIAGRSELGQEGFLNPWRGLFPGPRIPDAFKSQVKRTLVPQPPGALPAGRRVPEQFP